MVGGAVEDEDCVLPPVRVLAVELAGESVEEPAEYATVVASLAERKVAPAGGVDAGDDRQPMAERLRQLPQALAGDLPTPVDVGRLRQVGLVDIEDALACHQLLEQPEGELLPLVSAADGVGSGGERLRPLEAQAEVAGHDLAGAAETQRRRT